MNRRVHELLSNAAEEQVKGTAPATEVLEHLYRAILTVPEFKLRDGTCAKVDAYYEPEVGKEGELQFGFDVLLDDKSHLEFTLTNTGWGKSLAPNLRPDRRNSDERRR